MTLVDPIYRFLNALMLILDSLPVPYQTFLPLVFCFVVLLVVFKVWRAN